MITFLTLQDLLTMSNDYETNIAGFYNGFLGGLLSLFNGSNVNPYKTTSYLNAYISDPYDLLSYAVDNYETRSLYPKWKEGCKVTKISKDSQGNIVGIQTTTADKQAAYEEVRDKIVDRLNQWVDTNGYRVLRALGVLELEYNPIENYNMVEDGGDTTDGVKEVSRTYDVHDNPVEYEIAAPLTSFSISKTNQEISVATIEAAPTANVEVQQRVASGTEDRSGKLVTQVVADANQLITNTGVGEAQKTTNSVTTYDDDEFHNKDKSEVEGDTAHTGKTSAYTSSSQRGNILLKYDKLQRNFTDSESYENFGNTHSLNRSGNIGVTTTQQMMDQELAIRAKDVVNNFLRDAFNSILLQVG